MKVVLESVGHHTHPYPTIGYWEGDVVNHLNVRVSLLPDPRYEILVAVHELLEGILCQYRGITTAEVDAFDTAYEMEGHPVESEPGDDVRAPYRAEHNFATFVERMLANELDVEWEAYEAALAAMMR